MAFPPLVPEKRPDFFHPVVELPGEYEIYDFTKGYDPNRTLKNDFGVGKYGEDRSGMYTDEIFSIGAESRTVHLGIDFGAPSGTEVRAFSEGVLRYQGYLPGKGDYGHVIVCEHQVWGERIFALYGHLSARSLVGRKSNWTFSSGTVLGWVGDRNENGGWNPHLHFQLSRRDPGTYDMPGVVSRKQVAEASMIYPDPQFVTGRLY